MLPSSSNGEADSKVGSKRLEWTLDIPFTFILCLLLLALLRENLQYGAVDDLVVTLSLLSRPVCCFFAFASLHIY